MKKIIYFITNAVTLVFLSMAAQATIVYTDIAPDGLPSGNKFDFNGDAMSEFDINSNGNQGDYFTYTNSPTGTNIWANGTAQSGWDVPKSITAGTSIGASGNWIGQGDGSMDSWGQGSPFPVNQDSYLGVRIIIGGQTHYGWIRVMYDGTDFIYKDMAYEDVANTAIKAGVTTSQWPASVNDQTIASQVKLYPNPVTTEFRIKGAEGMSYTIYSVQGNILSNGSLKKAQETINVSALPKGFYYVHFRKDEASFTKAVTKQ